MIFLQQVMDAVEESFLDVSFDESVFEFKKCAESCLASREEENVVTVSDEDDLPNIFDDLNWKKPNRKGRKKAQDVKKVKPKSTEAAPTIPDKVNELNTALTKTAEEENLEPENSLPLVNTRRPGKRNVQDVPAGLDSVPLKQRLRSGRNKRTGSARRGVLLNTEPIVVDDEPRVPQIVIDSIELQDSEDDEVMLDTKTLDNVSLSGVKCSDANSEADNSEVRVKVWWRFLKMHFFNVRKYQKLTMIFEHFSKLENVPQECIWLTVRDSVNVKPTDTPDSLKLGVADIIEGGITSQKTELPTVPVPESPAEENSLEFKLLFKDRKKPLLLRIKNDQNMKLLMIKCAEELELPLDSLKFAFDGEPLDPSATPSDLDMEGGECIEVSTSK
ncbi:DNA repair protein Rad60 [Anabrus simplex]|uniref:DNA repair protein Rad60 n=1 Tax=Anabrus simplex TaxID=316456 RepID=UPI0035A3B4C3